MSKYIRNNGIISRMSDEGDSETKWLERFEKSLTSTAVQSREVDNSLFNQINTIMNGTKSKHTSVQGAVEDMMDRSGLKSYLAKKSEIDENNKKIASDQNEAIDKTIPIVIEKVPNIKQTLENYIKDTKGNLPIPAIIEKIKAIYRNDVSDSKDWDDEKLIRLVSKMNLQAKSDNPTAYENHNNLGKLEYDMPEYSPENSDAFIALMPAK